MSAPRDDARPRMVAAALRLEGTSYSANPGDYAAEQYPLDDHAQAIAMARANSSCGVTCEEVERDAGVDGTMPWHGQTRDWLAVAYAQRGKIGLTAIVFQVALARHQGAWVDAMRRDPADDARPWPDEGDQLLIGGQGATEAWGRGEYDGAHVFTVLSFNAATRELVSIDGGQGDAGNGGACTAVLRRTRLLVEVPQHRELWTSDNGGQLGADGRPTKGRRVDGWIDAGKLLFHSEAP